MTKKYNDLKEKFDFIMDICPETFDIPIEYRTKIRFFFERSSEPIWFDYLPWLSQAYFITLTFDPARFGVSNHTDAQKDYLLTVICQLFEKELALSVYGCFEFCKTGAVHTHMILQTNQINDVKKFCKSKLTFNAYNKHAVDVGNAKHPQAQQYIEKESVDYYTYTVGSNYLQNTNNGLDDGLEDEIEICVKAPYKHKTTTVEGPVSTEQMLIDLWNKTKNPNPPPKLKKELKQLKIIDQCILQNTR